MKFVSIQKQRVYQIVIDQIRKSVDLGELKSGDKLPSERELAEELSVSRAAVREAMSVLEAMRIVKVLPGVGIYIEEDPTKDLIARMDEMVKVGNSDLISLLEVRQAIESQAAHLAAIRRRDSDLRALEEAYGNLKQSVERNEVAAEEDYDFHIAVVEATYNPMLMEAVKFLSEKFLAGLYHSRSESIRIPGKSAIVLEEHWRIYRAIADKNAEQARKLMWEHLDNVKSRYY
ncbi:FadR/GntR family transcriptional regulator [Paenibacillus oceani]|uniref:FadR family transcriptional regulator n=1 Tax=Paenibacillus oceani TaxID=2772510 RepID=A0A927CDR6_9BACL|nr:FadR/GntR family transcriptional regulator [Paenibacillus oceani]MBD2865599.1 FadR family transcriptional regulator [Paenibacillus oceani]